MKRYTKKLESGAYAPNTEAKNQAEFIKRYSEEIQQLGAYEEAKEQGLLIKLPCKVGDTVYYTGFDSVIKVEVVDYDYWISDGFGIVGHGDFPNTGKLFFRFSQFGENLFYTKAEAEEALKGSVSEC